MEPVDEREASRAELAAWAVELYRAGVETDAVAKRVGRSRSWVYSVLRDTGIKPSRPRRPLDVEDVVTRYRDGDSLASIAKHYRVDTPRIRKALVDAGVAIRSASNANTKIDCDTLRDLYVDERRTIPQIAELLGVSESGVWHAMRRCDITPRWANQLDASPSQLQTHLDDGLTNAEIAELYGVTTNRVTTELRALGLRRTATADHAYPVPDVGWLRHRYETDRASIAEVATELGVPHAVVRRWLVDAGIEIRQRAHTPNHTGAELTRQDLVELYGNKGWTADEIGRHYGVTKRVVLARLHDEGLGVHPPGPRREGDPVALRARLEADDEIARLVAHHHGSDLGELVRDLYLNIGLSVAQIGLVTNIDPQHIRSVMQRHHIPTRTSSRSPWTERNPPT